MKGLERILKALSNRRRLAILKYLKRGGEATVGDIAGEISLSFKATSKHLRILAAADIVERKQRNLGMWYRLAEKQKPAAESILKLL